jgi:hypothetical protein
MAAVVPTILFLILDTYYLQQERKFRGVYNDVAGLSLTRQKIIVRNFEMPIQKHVGGKYTFFNDVMRVQQIRNIGVLEGNTPVSPNEWETVRRNGEKAIEKWIDDNMFYKSCVIVLVGTETAKRPWVQYEIKKAWDEGKGLLGIYIHNLKDPRTGTCSQGLNPFEQFTINNGATRLSSVVKCYNPKAGDAYNDIANNIDSWIEDAIRSRQ